jgi:TolB-like protein/Tfp pilus assembly protein PilF
VIYRFDAYSLDTMSLELRQDDVVVPVEPQVFGVLAYLIENRDRVVSKDELIDAVWDGRAISDGALNSRINSVRRAVGDDGSAQAVIKTFTRRGFRFIGILSEDSEPDGDADNLAAQFDKPSIAVLPFGNLSNNPDQEYFSDGITEDLITALSRIRRFRVAARSSTFSYKGQSPDARLVAREMDARFIVAGSVRKAGERIRLTVQLIDGGSGNHLWAESYDRELDNIFALQDELTLAIVGALEPAMDRAEQDRISRKPPESLDAWENYQKGTFHLNKRTREDTATARKLFQRAIEIDPKFALAHAGKARTFFFDALIGITDGDAKEAEASAVRAIELDSDEPESHLALGSVHHANRDSNRAIPELELAISLNPSYAQAYHLLGTSLVHSGRAGEALPHLLAAIRLSPKDGESAPFHARVGFAYFYLRQNEEAVEWTKKAVRLPGIQWPGHCLLVAALAHLDRMDDAHRAFEDLLVFRPGITIGFVRNTLPAVDPGDLDHLIEGLRKAGLPE